MGDRSVGLQRHLEKMDVAFCSYCAIGNGTVGIASDALEQDVVMIAVKREDELCRAIRAKQYSLMNEESYVGWYRRYVFHDGKRHTAEMGTV